MAHQLETNLIRDKSTRSADEEANEETAQLPAMIVAALKPAQTDLREARRQSCVGRRRQDYLVVLVVSDDLATSLV